MNETTTQAIRAIADRLAHGREVIAARREAGAETRTLERHAEDLTREMSRLLGERLARCAGCGAPIIWKYTPQGKRMPLDPAPLVDPAPGAYRIAGDVCHPAAPMFDPPDTVAHMNHWATCPVADQFKKGAAR